MSVFLFDNVSVLAIQTYRSKLTIVQSRIEACRLLFLEIIDDFICLSPLCPRLWSLDPAKSLQTPFPGISLTLPRFHITYRSRNKSLIVKHIIGMFSNQLWNSLKKKKRTRFIFNDKDSHLMGGLISTEHPYSGMMFQEFV